MNHRETVKGLSDHQILEMVDVMLDDDFSPADPARDTYLAAIEEAKARPLVWEVVVLVHPGIEEAV